MVKLDHSSHPYVIVGITTFLYKLADTFGFSPHGLTPVFARLKNEFLPFIQASLIVLFSDRDDSWSIPRCNADCFWGSSLSPSLM